MAYRENACAVVLFRDQDSDEDRYSFINIARDAHSERTGQPVLVGVAKRCREAWVLLGFKPRSKDEASSLDRLKSRISFDPTKQPERLNGRDDDRDPKKVLEIFTNGDFERETPCWLEADISEIMIYGKNCGLADYLKEVEEILIPALGYRV